MDQIWVQKVVKKGAAFCFKLPSFFKESAIFGVQIGASGRHDFDSGWDFKGKVGAEDDVVGKVQNDELSRVQECFNFLIEIEYLKVLGCLGKAKMSPFTGICKV